MPESKKGHNLAIQGLTEKNKQEGHDGPGSLT